MKLSQETLSILKNFAGINLNLVVTAGKVLQSVAVTKSILASANVGEEFPNDFDLYDLSEFLGVISLFKDPDLSFAEDHVVISEGRNKVKYMYGDKATFKVIPPKNGIPFADPEIEFEIDQNDLQSLIKASSILKLQEIAFTNVDGKFVAKVYDQKSPLSNSFSIDIEAEAIKGTFTMIAKVENLRMLPGSYKIEISSKKIAHLINQNIDVEYYIALEATSTFEG